VNVRTGKTHREIPGFKTFRIYLICGTLKTRQVLTVVLVWGGQKT